MIVFQTKEGKHLGFCLAIPNLEAASGNCIFQIMPLDPTLYEDEEVQYFFSLKEQGEHQWRWTSPANMEISFQGQSVLYLKDNETIEGMGGIIGRWFIHKKE